MSYILYSSSSSNNLLYDKSERNSMTVKEFMNSLVCVKVYPTLVYFVFEKCTVRATIGNQRKLFNWLITPETNMGAPAYRIQGWEELADISGMIIDKRSNSFEDSFSDPEESVLIIIEDQRYTIPVHSKFATSANEQARSEQYTTRAYEQVNFAKLMGVANDN